MSRYGGVNTESMYAFSICFIIKVIDALSWLVKVYNLSICSDNILIVNLILIEFK